MIKKMEKWLDHQFSSGCDTGADYRAFQKDARTSLRQQAEAAGYELYQFNKNHYEFSAVLRDKKTGAFVYVSINDVRYSRNDWYTHVLYRTMQHDQDWRGSRNRFCQWPEILRVLENMRAEGGVNE